MNYLVGPYFSQINNITLTFSAIRQAGLESLSFLINLTIFLSVGSPIILMFDILFQA